MRKFLITIIFLILTSSLAIPQRNTHRGNRTSAALPDFVVDSFTEASDVVLGSHTGELGATWTVHPSYGNVMNVDAATDRIFPTSNPSAFYASGIPPNANYKVCSVVFAHSNISVNIGPCGRINTTVNDMYCTRYNSGTTWELRRVLGGVQTTLTSSTNQLISLGNSKTACVIMNGTTISMTIDGTTEGTPVTDTNISAAGRAGVRSSGGMTATTGFHLDNVIATPL